MKLLRLIRAVDNKTLMNDDCPEEVGFRNQWKYASPKDKMPSYLPLGLEDVTTEYIALSISGNVTEDLQVLGVMRHIKYPV